MDIDMTDQDKKQIVEDWIKLAKTRNPILLQDSTA